MRERLREWLEQAGIDGQVAFDLVTACTEAFNNAIEHPLGPARDAVDVRASMSDSTIVVTVRDSGRWQDVDPRSDRDHHGYPLMRSLVEEVHVSRDHAGTEVTLRKRVPRP
jgi:anti-sigma regulatory factor (Ser/Thr protein kinase)